jgi:hypothetical protein
VPARLPARTRVFAAGQGRKTDAADAHSVALAAIRMTGLRPVVNDGQLAVLRILAGRRRSLGQDHTRMASQLHLLLLELIPGGALKSLPAAQAKALPARVRPRDAAGKARRRPAAELTSDLERICQRKKAAGKELNELVKVTGTTLTALHGTGPCGAARLLAEAGDMTRSRTRPTSRPRTAPRQPVPPPQTRPATGDRGPATARSTRRCTPWPSSSSATPPKAAPTTTARPPPARHPGKRCAPSNPGPATSPATRSSPATGHRRQARKGTRGRL